MLIRLNYAGHKQQIDHRKQQLTITQITYRSLHVKVCWLTKSMAFAIESWVEVAKIVNSIMLRTGFAHYAAIGKPELRYNLILSHSAELYRKVFVYKIQILALQTVLRKNFHIEVKEVQDLKNKLNRRSLTFLRKRHL